jgi:small-conductance mechanosensitive channel
MSGTSPTPKRGGFVADLLIFGTGGTIFLLAGLFSNFYTSSSIEMLLVVQGGLMVGYGVSVVYKKTKDEEATKNLIEQSFRLGFIYSVGVVLMLVNATVKIYSLKLYTAPIGYFVCIGSYLLFAAYCVHLKHSLKVNVSKSVGIVILIGVASIYLFLWASGAIRFALNFIDLWILTSAVLIGIAINLLTKQRPIEKAPSVPPPVQHTEPVAEAKEPSTRLRERRQVGKEAVSQDPIVIAKQWVQEQLVRVTIVDWGDLKLETRKDGKLVVSGFGEAQSGSALLPLRYFFGVVLTKNNAVVRNESSVMKMPGP